jgi:hypothetical protein
MKTPFRCEGCHCESIGWKSNQSIEDVFIGVEFACFYLVEGR